MRASVHRNAVIWNCSSKKDKNHKFSVLLFLGKLDVVVFFGEIFCSEFLWSLYVLI
jgi:hypothetical protein